MRYLVVDVPQLYRLWYSDLKGPEVCDALGVSDSSLQRLRARYKLPPRDHVGGPKGNRKIIDPSPEEIEERSAIERAKWTPEEERKRRVGAVASGVEIRRYAFNGRHCAFDY